MVKGQRPNDASIESKMDMCQTYSNVGGARQTIGP